MVSKKQVEANKNNALLGGVKTPEGKDISKYNALKHGIFRQSFTDYEKDFYSGILDDLNRQFQPKGIIEQLLIERIAIYYLKLYRVQKAETEFFKAKLNPTRKKIVGGICVDPEGLLSKEVILDEGYVPKITDENIQRLTDVYARYEITIENRLFRVIHELERVQRLRCGEKMMPSITANIRKMGSFGKTSKYL